MLFGAHGTESTTRIFSHVSHENECELRSFFIGYEVEVFRRAGDVIPKTGYRRVGRFIQGIVTPCQPRIGCQNIDGMLDVLVVSIGKFHEQVIELVGVEDGPRTHHAAPRLRRLARLSSLATTSPAATSASPRRMPSATISSYASLAASRALGAASLKGIARSRTTALAKSPMAVEGGSPISLQTSENSRFKSSSMLIVIAMMRSKLLLLHWNITHSIHMLNAFYTLRGETLVYKANCSLPRRGWSSNRIERDLPMGPYR